MKNCKGCGCKIVSNLHEYSKYPNSIYSPRYYQEDFCGLICMGLYKKSNPQPAEEQNKDVKP